MIALTFVGGFILAFFLWGGSKVNKDVEDAQVTPSVVNGIIIIIALAGFLIAAGLFSLL